MKSHKRELKKKNNQSLFLKRLHLHQKALHLPPLRRGLGMKSYKRELKKKVTSPFS
jgi:hypothetical protein